LTQERREKGEKREGRKGNGAGRKGKGQPIVGSKREERRERMKCREQFKNGRNIHHTGTQGKRKERGKELHLKVVRDNTQRNRERCEGQPMVGRKREERRERRKWRREQIKNGRNIHHTGR
jgi:hypothetical protein